MRLDHVFYPPCEPRATGSLALDALHTMHYQECGSASGAPLLILHGGPGGGINPYYRQLADPRHYRVVLFDQRGCGQSTPRAELRENTTGHLVADMERLREHLGLDRWIVLGGSWGSTLALAYAQRHPERVAALVLTGVFLARGADMDWWWYGLRQVFPDAWQAMHDFLPEHERGDLRSAYLRRCLDPDPAVHGPARLSLMTYETEALDVWPNWPRMAWLQDTGQAIVMGGLLPHYDAHDYFLEEGELLRGAGRLGEIPGRIVQGRHDAVCPPCGAFDLHRSWPCSTLQIVAGAGHAWNDHQLGSALVGALDELRELRF